MIFFRSFKQNDHSDDHFLFKYDQYIDREKIYKTQTRLSLVLTASGCRKWYLKVKDPTLSD
jgi:hypothetical protein